MGYKSNAEAIERARAMRMDSEVGTPVERQRILGELANRLWSADRMIEAVLMIHSEKRGESPVYDTGDWDHESEPIGWESYTVCQGCSASPYPCRTAQALGVEASSNVQQKGVTE